MNNPNPNQNSGQNRDRDDEQNKKAYFSKLSSNYGFRCVKLMYPNTEELINPLDGLSKKELDDYIIHERNWLKYLEFYYNTIHNPYKSNNFGNGFGSPNNFVNSPNGNGNLHNFNNPNNFGNGPNSNNGNGNGLNSPNGNGLNSPNYYNPNFSNSPTYQNRMYKPGPFNKDVVYRQ